MRPTQHVGETANFKVSCTDCELGEEAAEFDPVAEFAQNHKKHTDHDVEWLAADFDVNLSLPTKWELHCQTCDKDWEFNSEEKAQAFKQDHAEYTDHSINTPPSKKELAVSEIATDPSPKTTKETQDLIESLESHFEEGVPEQAIYGVFRCDPSEMAKMKTRIDELKQKGDVYEPSRNRLRTT